MVSNEWWLTAFGDYDPLGGTYIPIGLNRDSFAGMADLTMEKSDFILNDPVIGLKSSFPGQFMYGELSGCRFRLRRGGTHLGRCIRLKPLRNLRARGECIERLGVKLLLRYSDASPSKLRHWEHPILLHANKQLALRLG